MTAELNCFTFACESAIQELDDTIVRVRKQLGEEEQQTILRYARNYLGYKETYLAERK